MIPVETQAMLDVTRLQAGRLQLQCTPTDLAAVARRVASQMQQSTTRHQVEVHAPEQPLVADIDRERINQILSNLIGNASKYSPQGGPVLMTLEADPERQAVQVSVKDQGIGIPRHQRAQIFGRFMLSYCGKNQHHAIKHVPSPLSTHCSVDTALVM